MDFRGHVMQFVDFNSLIGSATGGGVVALMAKMYLEKAFQELETVIVTMHTIKEDLAAIAVKLERIEQNDEIIRKHDREISALNTRVFGERD